MLRPQHKQKQFISRWPNARKFFIYCSNAKRYKMMFNGMRKWGWKLMARQIWWCVCKIFRFIHFISADTAPKLQLIYNKPPTVLYMATQNTAFHVAFFFMLFLFLFFVVRF